MRINVRDKNGLRREGSIRAGCAAMLISFLLVGAPFFLLAWPCLDYWYMGYQLRTADGVTQATVISTSGEGLLQFGLITKTTRLIAYRYRAAGPDGRAQDFVQRDIASDHDVFTRLSVGKTVTIHYRTDNPAIARRIDALDGRFAPLLLWLLVILPVFGMPFIAGLNTIRFQVRRRFRSPAELLRDQQEHAQLMAQGLLYIRDAIVATRLRQMLKKHPQTAPYIVILDDKVFISPEYLHSPDDRKLLRSLLSDTSIMDMPAQLELSSLLELLPLTGDEQARQRKSSEELLRSLLFDMDKARQGQEKSK